MIHSHEYPEDTVEEGLDLVRISGEHRAPKESHLEPRASDEVLVDFEVERDAVDSEVFLAVRLMKRGLAPIDPVVLGLVRASSDRIAAILTRSHWNLALGDFILYPRDRIVAMLKLVLDRA